MDTAPSIPRTTFPYQVEKSSKFHASVRVTGNNRPVSDQTAQPGREFRDFSGNCALRNEGTLTGQPSGFLELARSKKNLELDRTHRSQAVFRDAELHQAGFPLCSGVTADRDHRGGSGCDELGVALEDAEDDGA